MNSLRVIFRKVYKTALIAARSDWKGIVDPKKALLVPLSSMPEHIENSVESLRIFRPSAKRKLRGDHHFTLGPYKVIRASGAGTGSSYGLFKLYFDQKYDAGSAQPDYAKKEFQAADLPLLVVQKIGLTVKNHISNHNNCLAEVLDCVSNDEKLKHEIKSKAEPIGFKLCMEKFEVKMLDGRLVKLHTFLESDEYLPDDVVDVIASGQSITMDFGNNAKTFEDVAFHFDRQVCCHSGHVPSLPSCLSCLTLLP